MSRDRRHTASQRSQIVLAVVAAVAISHCGAKTGLLGPCFEPAIPATPQIVVVLDHSVQVDQIVGRITFDAGGFHDLAEFGTIVQTLNQTLPSLDDAALGLYVFPDIGVRDLMRQGQCSTPDHLLAPIAVHNSAQVLATIHVWDDGSGDNWNNPDQAGWGSAPVDYALTIAQRALSATPSLAPHFALLITALYPSCNSAIPEAQCSCPGGSPSDCFGVATAAECSDARRAVSTIATMLASGTKTLVIGEDHDPEGTQPLEDEFRIGAAQAGGMVRPGSRPWYGVREVAAIQQELRSHVITAGICYPHLAQIPARIDDYRLSATPGGNVERDPTHTNGWDWVDESRGTLRVYGPACTLLEENNATLTFVSQHYLCESR